MAQASKRRTAIKICGLKSVPMAEEVSRLEPDLVGFVFANSKRKVSPELAGAMITALRAHSKAKAVGVFVNPTMEELDLAMTSAPLDVIQLHGSESPDVCRQVRQRYPTAGIYKVFGISAEERGIEAAASQLEPYRGVIDAAMIDTQGGGTGKTFTWDVIPHYAAAAAKLGLPLIVAGGLDPDNVGELVTAYRPDGVDVSSGVETNGEKDLNKIVAFIERVNSIDQERT